MVDNNLLNIEDIEIDEEEQTEEKEAWKIEDLGGADWCFRKIKEAEDDFNEQVKYVKAEIEKYQEYINKLERQKEDKTGFFKYKLQEYLMARQEEDPNFKLKTMVGSANFKNKTTWDYGNEDKLIEFLENHDLTDFVKIKENKSINKSELRKNMLVLENGIVTYINGQIIEGVVVNKEKEFFVKLS